MKRLHIAPVAAAMAFLSSCGSTTTDVGGQASVQVTTTADTLTALGQTASLTAAAQDESGNTVNSSSIGWRTSNASVVQVNSVGQVTAVGNGATFVTALYRDASDSVEVIVHQRPSDIQVDAPADTVFQLGVRARLTATVTDAQGALVPPGHAPVQWGTTDSTTATIDADGRVTPIADGTVTLTATVDTLTTSRELTIDSDGALAVPVTLAEQLQWAIEDALPTTNQFGVTAAVILPDGSEWVGVTGWRRPGVPLRSNALISLGSISKSMVGAVLLRVVNEGLVALDDTVGQWLAPLTNVSPDVSMRDLLRNSSGIANYASHPSIGDSVFADTSRLWTTRELVDRFTGPPEFSPGARYKSSNTNFLVAAMVAAEATNEPYTALFRNRVLDPLGLGTEFYYPPHEPPPPTAVNGWFADGTGQIVDFTPFMSTSLLSARGQGLSGSAVGVARFMRSFVTGSLLNPSLQSEALSAIPDDGLIPGQDGAGLGLRRYNYLGGRQWGHSGAVSNGTGLVFHDPTLGITVTVLFNVNGIGHGGTHFSLGPALLQMVRDANP